MYSRPTTPTEIIRRIQNLKSHKAFGPDGIPAEVIKHCVSVLAPVLSELVNLSFSKGRFPSCLGAAKVIPLHKNGDKTNMTNYWPISLLSVISKVFERVMYSRISEFLERHQLLSKSQFGFRSKRSCIDAIASIVERIRSDHSKTDYTCIFLDLQKAFDTVDHPRLLHKIYKIGIRGNALRWLESYLECRTQMVSINGHSSEAREVKYGVPQGSILGPLLFIIYMNDLDAVCKMIRPTLFADDANLLISRNKPVLVETETEFQKELQDVDGWIKVNKLSLNVPKSHCMPFKKKNRKQEFAMGSELLQISDIVKYLEILIDRNLKFQEHIEYLLKKLGKHIGVISRLRHFVSRSVLLKYYNFYVKPVLQYNILIYGGNTFANLDKLNAYHCKLFRLILFKKKTAKVDNDFLRYDILSVTQLYFYELIKFSFRSVRGELSCEFLNNLYSRANARETRMQTA